MSYGSVTHELREAFGQLLYYRVARYWFGAAHPALQNAPPTKTPEQQAELSHLVQKYQYEVLRHLESTARLLVGPTGGRSSRTPFELRQLASRLTRTLEATPGERPTSEELGAAADMPLVEAWRRAAVAVVIEREFVDPAATFEGVSRAERATVLKDTADLTRALVILDDRYDLVPGWRHLGDYSKRRTNPSERSTYNAGLYNAAIRASRFLVSERQDFAVDNRGRRVRRYHGPSSYAPSAAGVLRALHDTLLTLDKLPHAQALRALLRVQYEISAHAAALHATVTRRQGIPDYFTERAAAYWRLTRATKNVSGKLGGPAAEALETSRQAAEILKDVDDASRDEVREIQRALTVIDRQIARIIHTGARTAAYVASRHKVIDTTPQGGVRKARPVWERIDFSTPPDLLDATAVLEDLARRSAPKPTPARMGNRPAFTRLVQEESAPRPTRVRNESRTRQGILPAPRLQPSPGHEPLIDGP
ncbi:hypothetical protein [Myceligenerans xiligouense]|uniref:Uncharacterized protein n=1 Tax=Myceligenerans xiligouense TaxID=253184 RepID=A0A3N4YJZ0_9MICO|nr:hypothetical protein [Myceligenerans xiligouense]RPF21439.1 hypothetical protein EDD34_2067 [Myceligenerans xiligouense]